MSTQYDKEIFSNSNLTLKVNFSGIKNSAVSTSDLKMSIYAYDKTGQPLFAETLYFEEIKSLYEHLNQISIIKDSSQTTSGKFVETTDEISDIFNKLKNVDTSILKIVLNKLNEEDKIKNLFVSLSEDDEKGNNPLDILSGLQKQQGWQTEIENLKKLLELEEGENIVKEIKKHESLKAYKAGQPEKIFQKWIEKNIKWVFGVEYIKRHDASRIGLSNIADLLMESMDGFLDLIELKRPKLKSDIFKYDSSHNCYYPSPDLSEVIGQCMFYLQKMDDYKLNIENDYKVKVLRPRIKIIAGRTKDFNDEQNKALRMLNCNLNHIQIISYDYLLSCGEKMISNL